MSADTEFEVAQRLANDLESEGYEVYLQPNKLIVPTFLGNFAPDIIAKRFDKNIVIEVLQKLPHTKIKNLDYIASLFENRSDWEFRVIWIHPNRTTLDIPIQESRIIKRRVDEARTLANAGHLEAAMLMAWATLEALARAVSPDKFLRPQTPGRIVQTMASDGYVTPNEADLLRILIKKRNDFIHGDLQIIISENEISQFCTIIETLIDQINQPNENN